MNVTKGQSYIVTSFEGCTVTCFIGNYQYDLIYIKPNTQGVFVAISDEVTLSDRRAIIQPFNKASIALGGNGGGVSEEDATRWDAVAKLMEEESSVANAPNITDNFSDTKICGFRQKGKGKFITKIKVNVPLSSKGQSMTVTSNFSMRIVSMDSKLTTLEEIYIACNKSTFETTEDFSLYVPEDGYFDVILTEKAIIGNTYNISTAWGLYGGGIMGRAPEKGSLILSVDGTGWKKSDANYVDDSNRLTLPNQITWRTPSTISQMLTDIATLKAKVVTL